MPVTNITPLEPQIRPVEIQSNKTRQVEAAGQQKETQKKPQYEIAAADLKRLEASFNRRLQFEVNMDSNEVIIKVIDKNTDKVIKELPPEDLQRLSRSLRESMGVLFDESV